MRDHSSMSDAEIREHLKFGPRWFALGIMDEEALTLTIRNFRASDDDGDEHWRYGAFRWFLSQHPQLTPEQCEGLIELGAEDPDWTMGQSIMLDVLDRPECPDHLYDIAASHPRTTQYYAGFDLVQHRKRKPWDPEDYYRQKGLHKDGRPRRDQIVYREMEAIFGIDFARFQEIKKRALHAAG